MPIYPGETCPICGENPNITNICEDCREIFCDDCMDVKAEEKLICAHCGSSEIYVDSRDTNYCKNCQSKDVKHTKDLIPICPNCDGTNVIKIKKKQKQLLDHYKEIINNSREFLKPLSDILDELRYIREILLELRETSPESDHYPNLESNLLVIFQLFNSAKHNLYENVNKFFQEIQRNINYIADIPITHPSNLPYIHEILLLFEKEHKKVKKFSRSSIENLINKIDEIKEKLNFMESIQTLFKKFMGKFQLEPDEQIVYGIECKLSSGENDEDNYSRKKGTILITSKRIHFLHEKGIFKKRNVLLFSVNLDDLQEVDIKGTLTKKVSLDFVNSMYQFKLSKENRNILIKWIKKARSFEATNYIDDNKFRKMRKFKLDLRMFKNELENAIYELVGYHGAKNTPQGDMTGRSNHLVNERMYKTSDFTMNSRPKYRHATAQKQKNQNRHSGKSGYNQSNSGYGQRNPPQHGSKKSFEDRNPSQFGYPHDQKTMKSPFTKGNSVENKQFQNGFQNENRFSSNSNYSGGNKNEFQPSRDQNKNQQFQNFKKQNRSAQYSNQNPHNNRMNRSNIDAMFRQFSKRTDQQGFEQSGNPQNPQSNGSFSRGFGNSFTRAHSQGGPANQGNPSYAEQSNQNHENNFEGGNFGQSNRFGQFGNNFGGFNRNNREPKSNYQKFQQRTNEEFQVKSEIQKLQQEEFALGKTIKMLEKRFDAGYMSNVEFIKSYREMQREKFNIKSKIGQLQQYLRDNFTFVNN